MSKRTSRMLLISGASLAMCLLGGCPFQVVFPAAMQTTSQNFQIVNDKLQINVAFSAPVNMSSLVAGTNVILVTEEDPNADITIAAGATAVDIVITTVADYGDLLEFDPDGFFTLRLLGSGANPIQSTAGDTLDGDGDGDGSAGGNYETTFVVIG